MHRAHDPKHLLARWRSLTRAADLRLRQLAVVGKFPIHYLRSGEQGDSRTIYISAGVHGDEPASPAALLSWAEQNAEQLRSHPFLLFPCLNPAGLLANVRNDASGCDLNRAFRLSRPPSPIRELKRLIRGEKFALALALHEDYDAEGIYIYEAIRAREPFWGEKMLAAAQPLIAAEPRQRIEGRRARGGVVRRQFRPRTFPLMPESIYLHQHHSFRTCTIETPSEFAFEQRVAALVAATEEAVQLSIASRRGCK
ncbi:hypothetical protein BH20VER2_BH20VER2_02540 [soil metagenome]